MQDVGGIFAAARFLILIGRPGGGKSSVPHAIAAITSRRVMMLNFSGSGPCEVSGYGVPHEAPAPENGSLFADLMKGKQYDMAFAAPDVLPLLRRVGDEPILLVLDEFTDWPPAIQSLFRGVFDTGSGKMVGTHVLGTDVAVMITGNRKEDGSKLSSILPAPLVNRGTQYELDPNVTDWTNWFVKKYPESKSPVAAFLNYGQAQVNRKELESDFFCPPVTQPWDGQPYPSPRGWEAVALMDGARTENRKSFARMVHGTVGDAAAVAFLAFAAHADKVPNVAKLISGEISLPTDGAEQYAWANAILIHALNQCPKDRAPVEVKKGGFDWLAKLIKEMRGDIAAFVIGTAINSEIPMDTHPATADLYKAMNA